MYYNNAKIFYWLRYDSKTILVIKGLNLNIIVFYLLLNEWDNSKLNIIDSFNHLIIMSLKI